MAGIGDATSNPPTPAPQAGPVPATTPQATDTSALDALVVRGGGGIAFAPGGPYASANLALGLQSWGNFTQAQSSTGQLDVVGEYGASIKSGSRLTGGVQLTGGSSLLGICDLQWGPRLFISDTQDGSGASRLSLGGAWVTQAGIGLGPFQMGGEFNLGYEHSLSEAKDAPLAYAGAYLSLPIASGFWGL